ncbi:MAG: phenylacetate-CoA oxygenase subunit PaaJ [Pseudomonadota bacterium]
MSIQVEAAVDEKMIWQWLEAVADPEIPVISIVDLGIVREVCFDSIADQFIIAITPTYSGCPATAVIAADISSALKNHGVENFRLENKLSPAWTTDWLSAKGRKALREYGIAPPAGGALHQVVDASRIMRATLEEAIECPHCKSKHTKLSSQFGSTPCKALYVCQDCKEPFDYFKPH